MDGGGEVRVCATIEEKKGRRGIVRALQARAPLFLWRFSRISTSMARQYTSIGHFKANVMCKKKQHFS
jgi:hypothetical protein